MAYVITCGDEGVQINEGTRLAVVGAGFQVAGFSEVVAILKKLFGEDLRIAASEENDWTRKQLDLSNWEQTNASAQQHIQVLADKEKLLYAGSLPFADPQELKHDIKGHMVRPHGIHIATKIALTLGGGEQTYHLGQFMICAEWVSDAKPELVKQVIGAQIDFYRDLVKNPELPLIAQTAGELGAEKAAKNQQVLQQLGFVFTTE